MTPLWLCGVLNWVVDPDDQIDKPTTNALSTSLLNVRRSVDSLRDHCVMDFSQSVMPTLLALAVIGTLLLVAFQAAA